MKTKSKNLWYDHSKSPIALGTLSAFWAEEALGFERTVIDKYQEQRNSM